MSNGNTKGKGIEPGCTAMIVGHKNELTPNNGKSVTVMRRIAAGDHIKIGGDMLIVGRHSEDVRIWLVAPKKDGLLVRSWDMLRINSKVLTIFDPIPVAEKNLIRLDDPSELTEDDIIETVNNLRKQTEQKILSDAINNMLNGN